MEIAIFPVTASRPNPVYIELPCPEIFIPELRLVTSTSKKMDTVVDDGDGDGGGDGDSVPIRRCGLQNHILSVVHILFITYDHH